MIHSTGMSARPSYYSGRGATISDLDSKKLEKIHEQIAADVSADAAANFVKMVENMESMNATDFLNNCFVLEANEYKWNTESAPKFGFEIDKDESGTHSVAQGMMYIAAAMSRGVRDDTQQIRGDFLRRHSISAPERNNFFNL